VESLLKTSSLEKISNQNQEFRWGFILTDFYRRMKRVAVEIMRKGKDMPIKYEEDLSQLPHLTLSNCDFV